jgi:hypothetical protein
MYKQNGKYLEWYRITGQGYSLGNVRYKRGFSIGCQSEPRDAWDNWSVVRVSLQQRFELPQFLRYRIRSWLAVNNANNYKLQ